jgi:hypothetical protein
MLIVGAYSMPCAGSRIPKVVIGNPDKQHIAWDFIANSRPYLAPEVSIDAQTDVLYWKDQKILLDVDTYAILSQCNGHTTIWEIIQKMNWRDDSIVYVFARLKWARDLGLVKWDFRIDNEAGVFIRRRELTGTEVEHHWFYMSPLAKFILDLCSGAYSCDEILEKLRELPLMSKYHLELQDVVEICEILVKIGIVEWVDDIEARQERLQAMLM